MLSPIIVCGIAALPDDARLNLTLMDERRFDIGVVHVHYAAT